MRVLLLVLALVALAVPVAHADVYWAANAPTSAIGRVGDAGCKPNRSFVTGLDDPRDVVVAGGYVYWTGYGHGDGHHIGRARLDGTGVDPHFIDTELEGNLDSDGEPLIESPLAITADATHVYWSTNTIKIGRAKLDGSQVEPEIVSAFSQGLTVDGSHLYWSASVDHQIGRSDLNGGNADPGYITTPEDFFLTGLALRGGSLFYTAFDQYDPQSPDPQRRGLWRVANAAGATPDNFLPFETTPGLEDVAALDVAATTSRLYWAGATAIGLADLDGSSPDPEWVTAPDVYQLSWTPTDRACADDVPPEPEPDPEPAATGSPSGSPDPGPAGAPAKHPTATQVMCTYVVLTRQDRCTATVGDAAPVPTTPTGAVTFSAADGGFPYGRTCTLAASPSAPTAPSCSVVYTPPGGTSALPAMTATYAGDGTHAGSSGATTLLAAGGGVAYGASAGGGGPYPTDVTVRTTVTEDDSDVVACAGTDGGAGSASAAQSGLSLADAVKQAADAARQVERAKSAGGTLKQIAQGIKKIGEQTQRAVAELQRAQETGVGSDGRPLTASEKAEVDRALAKAGDALSKISAAAKASQCLLKAGAGASRASIAKRKRRTARVRSVKLGYAKRTGVDKGPVRLRLKLSRKAVRKAAKGRKALRVTLVVAVIAPSPGVKGGVPALDVKTLVLKRRR